MRFLDIVIHELGFASTDHFMKSIFGWKTPLFLAMQIGGSAISITLLFIKEWIWDPPSGVFIFIVLVLLESLTGTYVAVKIKGECFNFQKFYNVAPKLLAHILLLSLSYNLGNHSILLVWLPNACFGWFATRNFLAITLNLIKLKLVKGDFAEFLRKKFEVENKEIIETIDKDLNK